MADAWIQGNPATLQAAIEEAARLLHTSRMPVIAGLGTDVAGARAAIALAQKIGAAVDHMHSAALLRDLDVMREAGMMATTPNEARLRADLLLLVGPGLRETWPDLPERFFTRPAARDAAVEGRRRIIWLCPGSKAKDVGRNVAIEVIGNDPTDLPILLAALRARCAGRPVSNATVAMPDLDALAATLAQTRFGVAVWSSAHLDVLAIEMLCGLVKDLNAATRFSGLPLAPGDNAAAVQQVSGWLTGFPLRTAFGRGAPEHDPWRFDAVRMVDSGEADCALWISAYGATRPAWTRDLPLIVLTETPDGFGRPPDVAIAVGRPGIDHDAVEHRPATGTLAERSVCNPTDTISVADAVTRIVAALPAAPPC
jgi:formylmethanofuran dehydrogenase subunit B